MTQDPARQMLPGEQGVSQFPQWSRSVCVSTHRLVSPLVQTVNGDAQVQMPAWQVSPPVPQLVPSATGVNWQPIWVQTSVVQGLPSSQRLSSGVWTQDRVASSQVSIVQVTESLQLRRAHQVSWQTPFRQFPLWQSASLTHPWPPAHAVGQEPPQSTPVSSPFRTPSAQVGSWQTVPEQTWLAQSAFA
jgi:hypothetical protein